ncbi:putative BsuMI modification methylase subunit YdiO [Mycobacteroides salmoniphilum]|nr:putative BsuMI modification methylase subunit YdiO [Mycobacteroides salmoniphilum]
MLQAGLSVAAGFDIDPLCRYPFEENIGGVFMEADIESIKGTDLQKYWGKSKYRVLVGCAPCQPFSAHRRGADPTKDKRWPLLDEFKRLIAESLPDIVSMENVPRIETTEVFKRFVAELEELEYFVDYRVCYAPDFGLPQRRRRMVLLASRLGPITVPTGNQKNYKTVRQTIEKLPPLISGQTDTKDPLHKARNLTDINLRRIQASKPGGTWRDWPKDLRSACHQKDTGASFQSVYARMCWDEPAPTITTQAFNFGTGRFGHPEQDRSLTLREAAMLQGFPRNYRFQRRDQPIYFTSLGRLIGNAVPPPLGKAIGKQIRRHITEIENPQ